MRRASTSAENPLARTTNWLARSALGNRRRSQWGSPPDSRPGADRLNVAGPCQAHISNAVAMSHRPLADVTDNLHVGVAVQIEAAPGGNLVVVPDEERTHRSVYRITLRSDFEMMSGIE